MQNPESKWFGEKQVSPDEKTGLVRGVFDSVAVRYDIMNDLMSGGLHRLWKDSFVRRIRPRSGLRYLDVAGGTGDIAFRIQKRVDAATPITICDLNQHMLAVGRERAEDRALINRFEWVTGNAETLPFPDHSFDVYTIAFGLRNVSRIDTALREAWRVLRPGGRFFCLEFSHVEEPVLRKFYDLYSFNVIPKIGNLVAKDADSYQYLVESIRKFPTQENLKQRLEHAGFVKAAYSNMTMGVVCIHSGVKL